MEIIVVLLFVVTCIIAIVSIILLARRDQRKNDESLPPQIFVGKSYAETFTAYFDSAFDLLKSSPLYSRNRLELAAFLSAVGVVSVRCAGKSASAFLAETESAFLSMSRSERMNEFRDRRDFYLSICHGKPALGFWSHIDIPDSVSSISVFRCAVAFADCITDPERISNYDHAPILIHDFFEVQRFNEMFYRDFLCFVKTYCIAIAGRKMIPPDKI